MKHQTAAPVHRQVFAGSRSDRTVWRRSALFLGIASAFALPAHAQTSAPALEEIVVTATRREESLQNVPLTVSAVTGEEIARLKMFRFEDIQTVTPGLSMGSTTGGASGGAISLRGVGFNTNASTSPAVDVYYNELPLDASFAFNSMFDVQQVEVLRGPQGTLRGRPAPAGAITLTTRRPDLNEFGGTVTASASDADVLNLQGAVNVPIIEDMLAVRVAAVKDKDEGGGQRDLANGNNPEYDSTGGRISVQFDPTEALSFLLTYQYLDPRTDFFPLVEGKGAGYNGPGLKATDRRGVQEGMDTTDQDIGLTSLLATWDLDANRIIYIGGYQDLHFNTNADLDNANTIPDYIPTQYVDSDYEVVSHELRLESSGADRRWDYILGLWYHGVHTQSVVDQPQEFDGAFGFPRAPVAPLQPFTGNVNIDIPTDNENAAIFGNVVFHVLESTDLSLGLRYLDDQNKRKQALEVGPGQLALPGLAVLCPEPLQTITGLPASLSTIYPGACELTISQSNVQNADRKETTWVYNASITHHFSDELMAYFTMAHSWRPPGVTVGITAPMPSDLIFGDSEESDSFELGMKSEWLDGRLRFNGAVYYQEFDKYIGRFENIPYDSGPGGVLSGGFSYGADASVSGVDLDLSFLVTDNWTADFAFNYSDGDFDNVEVPCRDTDFDGKADGGPNPAVWPGPNSTAVSNPPQGPVAFCVSDDPIATTPDWSATLQSEYTLPRGSLEYYVRGLLNYQPENSNVQTYWERDSFATLNLFVGVRTVETGWDVTLWTKNLFDDDTTLNLGQEESYNGFNSGYYLVQVQPERQIGMTLSYSFGGG